MQVQIEDRRDYELHVKKSVATMTVSNKQKAIFRKIAMHCFDDGLKFSQGNLKVEAVV